MFGSISLAVLVLIYAPLVLKQLAKVVAFDFSQNLWVKSFLTFLKKTHTWLGGGAVILILGHCYLNDEPQENIFLLAIIAVMLVSFLSGLLLKLNLIPTKFKSWTYRAHTHWLFGLVLLGLVILGHLFLSET